MRGCILLITLFMTEDYYNFLFIEVGKSCKIYIVSNLLEPFRKPIHLLGPNQNEEGKQRVVGI